MADIDLFGYQRSKVPTFLYSSDYAAVYFANSAGGSASSANKAGLVQSAAVSYQHNVQPKFESGSHELFWLTGQALGTMQLGRLIGDRGILEGIQVGNNPNRLDKGILGGINVKLGTKATGVSIRQEVLLLSGCVMSGYGLSFNVGGLEVQEAMTIQTAMVRRGLNGAGGSGLSAVSAAVGEIANSILANQIANTA